MFSCLPIHGTLMQDLIRKQIPKDSAVVVPIEHIIKPETQLYSHCLSPLESLCENLKLK